MNAWMERKLTAHATLCHFCHRKIDKGDFRLVIRCIGYHQQASLYAHPDCLTNWSTVEVSALRAIDKGFNFKDKINPSRRDQ
jgi:hypothetical protein